MSTWGVNCTENESSFRDEVNRCCELVIPHLGLGSAKCVVSGYGAGTRGRSGFATDCFDPVGTFHNRILLGASLDVLGDKTGGAHWPQHRRICRRLSAGVFTVEDALALVVERGRLMQEMPTGAMLAVPMPEDELQKVLPAALSLSTVNGPSQCVVSGPTPDVDAFMGALTASGKTGTKLHTSHAFHSGMMDPILRPFAECLRKVKRNEPTIPFISNLTGTWISSADATNPEYWAKHLRNTVRFADGVRELLKEPNRVLLEVGPGKTLGSLAERANTELPQRTLLSSMRHPQEGQSNVAFLMSTLGRLWFQARRWSWSGFYAHERRRRISLHLFLRTWRYSMENAKRAPEKSARLPVQRNPDVADWFTFLRGSDPNSRTGLKRTISPRDKLSWLIFADGCGFSLKNEFEDSNPSTRM